ncbi:MAG: SigE family RNA polymerase sigma factor [Actinomycetota bacterium]
MSAIDVQRSRGADIARPGRLSELYELHGRRAVKLAYLLTGDSELAQDLVQDAFVKLAGRWQDLRHPDAFDAYLRKTVVNLTRMHFRRMRIERAYLERERGVRERAVQSRDIETYEEMKAALLKLNPRQRAALVLRYYEDLSEAQIADVLDCPIGTVKSLISRAVAALRPEVDRDY